MIFTRLHPHLMWSFGCIFTILLVSTFALHPLKGRVAEPTRTELRKRIISWWIMISVFVGAMAVSRNASLLLFTLVSFLALKEYFSLIESRRADRRVLFWAYLTIPVQYYWIMKGWYGMFVIFIPIYVSLFLPLRMILIGETEGFVKSAATVQWGLMKTVFCLSHNAALLVLPCSANRNGGGPGLVLFLVALTQFNDVAQYIWGKSLGRRMIVPTISPGKRWERFLGGMVSTTAVTYFAAPFLTPFSGGTKFLESRSRARLA